MAVTVESHFRIPAGARWSHTLEAPRNEEGGLIDVTGWSGQGQIKPNPSSSVVYHEWPTEHITCAGTEVTVTVPAAVSRVWSWTAAVYLIDLYDPAAPEEPYRLTTGVVVIDPWPLLPPRVEAPAVFPTAELFPSTSLYPQGA
jgi:hypothetical protein